MAQLTACDNCGRTARDDFGWWTLDVQGIDLRFGDGESPYSFCGLVCVAAFAEQHAERSRDMLRPYSQFKGDNGR